MKNFNRAIQRHCKIFLIQVTKITNLHNKLKPNPHKSGQPHQNLDFLILWKVIEILFCQSMVSFVPIKSF